MRAAGKALRRNGLAGGQLINLRAFLPTGGFLCGQVRPSPLMQEHLCVLWLEEGKS